VSPQSSAPLTASEEALAKLDKEVPFILEDRLTELGANFVAREPKADHVERDGLSITGQNPASSASVARALVAALKKTFPPPLNLVGTDLLPAQTLVEFQAPSFIENIAVDPTGDLFVSSIEESRVYRVTPAGSKTSYADVPRAAGLAFAKDGRLLVGSTIGSAAPGVYRLSAGGKPDLVVPMPDAVFLNGMTHLSVFGFRAARQILGIARVGIDDEDLGISGVYRGDEHGSALPASLGLAGLSRWRIILGRVIENEHPVELFTRIGGSKFAFSLVCEFADLGRLTRTRIEPPSSYFLTHDLVHPDLEGAPNRRVNHRVGAAGVARGDESVSTCSGY
jgi:hypothetical protein